MNSLIKIVITIILLPFLALSQVKLEVKIEKTSLKLGEVTQVNYVFNEEGRNFVPPSFAGFNKGGSYVSSNEVYNNGVYSIQQVYTYVIQAAKAGKVTISPANIRFDGKVYASNPVLVSVSNEKASNAIPRQNPPATPKPNSNNKTITGANNLLFVDVEVNKTSAFVNEPVEVYYRIYLAPNLDVELNKKIATKFNNFWSQTEDVQGGWERSVVNNRVYKSKLFKKAILYPQKTGKLEITPITLDLNINYPTGDYDFFGQPEYRVARREVVSNVKHIQVNPLPEKGKPDNFTGAVGKFEFNVNVQKSELKSGESLQLDLIVSGNGNLKLFEIPKPSLPSNFEIYEPKHQEFISENMKGISGKIMDSYTIIPQEKGVFRLKPQLFSFFDVQSKSYKTISSEAVDLNVLQGENQANVTATSKAKPEVKEQKEETKFGFEFTFMHFIGTVAAGGLALLFFTLKRNKKPSEEEVIVEEEPIKKDFSVTEIQEFISNKELFYQKMEGKIAEFLHHKFSLEKADFNKDNIIQKFQEYNVSPENTTDFIGLLQSCEKARYMPTSEGNMQLDFEKLQHLVQVIGA
ncbi:protein BatD [Flavobacterium sp. F372]|uniref:Protein BatD n=1 Tax=Flavobacterium bernardetii TaxID=2813823 RepID=A0ABR7IYD3_9FLAO|nr:BatD family protein [Flavobacterium bernardetii]MBC5834801.1 protein BatD [Flavobacterium bernardetii]NHF70646.1 protein BatD [Flavobacterium bernardetii]